MQPPPSILAITPEQTYPLRHRVLWPDKPLDYVKVENDAEGYHFGAFRQDRLLAVISLYLQDNAGITEARFRKFAVHPGVQRQGIGTLLLNHVIAEASQMGATALWCDARLSTASFYHRFGMKAISEVFYKETIPYARFSRTL